MVDCRGIRYKRRQSESPLRDRPIPTFFFHSASVPSSSTLRPDSSALEADSQVYISSRSAKACEETAARLNKLGPGKCIALPGDLSKFDECLKLAEELEKREKGELRILSIRYRITLPVSCLGWVGWDTVCVGCARLLSHDPCVPGRQD